MEEAQAAAARLPRPPGPARRKWNRTLARSERAPTPPRERLAPLAPMSAGSGPERVLLAPRSRPRRWRRSPAAGRSAHPRWLAAARSLRRLFPEHALPDQGGAARRGHARERANSSQQPRPHQALYQWTLGHPGGIQSDFADLTAEGRGRSSRRSASWPARTHPRRAEGCRRSSRSGPARSIRRRPARRTPV